MRPRHEGAAMIARFTAAKRALPRPERRRIKKRLAKEIHEIFYGRNLN